MADRANKGDFLIAVYIIVPLIVLLLLLVCLYVCRTRRYRLNWYEKTILEESTSDACQLQKRNDILDGEDDSYKGYRIKRNRVCGKRKRGNPLAAIVEVLKHLKEKFSTRLKVSLEQEAHDTGEPTREGDRTTEWIVCSKKTMGSSPSSPVNEDAGKETFWVPPAVADRKRAQSLIPTIPHRSDSEEEGSSGTATPASLVGVRDLTCSYPSAPLLCQDGLPSPIPPGNRQRRASMQDAIDFRQIDSKLYDRRLQRQQSVASIEEEQLGDINFTLSYNQETHLLTVHLIQAENLVSREFSGTSDPYCKACLLPNRRAQLQSKVHRKTLNPVFEEDFIFEVSPMDYPAMTLELLLYDFDKFSRDECIGQVKLPLDNIDVDRMCTFWKPIVPVDPARAKETDFGDVIFSLGYLSSAERLTVVVMKARNLHHSEDGKITMDPSVKVSLLLPGKKIKKKRTSAKHNIFSPVWNEALTFSLSKEHLQNVCLEFAVLHDNKIGNDDVLGKTIISRDSDGDERLHWDEMVNCRSAVARWHKLTS